MSAASPAEERPLRSSEVTIDPRGAHQARMRVLVLTINYAPEPAGFAPHVTALCEYLVQVGHEVTTITGFPFTPSWVRWDDEGKGWIARETRKGVDLFRVRHFVPWRPRRLAERVLMETTYGACAAWTVLTRRLAAPDVILYVGAQPSIAMLARALGRWWRRPYVVAINDLAAQAAGDVGIVRGSWLMRALRGFEMAAYRHARAAIVLCRAFRDTLVADGYPSDRIALVPSPVDIDLVRPTADGAAFRTEHGIDPRACVVLYAGSMGIKQDLRTVVAAARRLGPDAGILWVLVGDGELKSEIAGLVSEHHLTYVRLLPFQDESRMAAMFSAADILLLGQLATVKDTVIPSKLLTYMAAGRPVLAAVHADSEAAHLMNDAQGGRLVPPESPEALADAVIAMWQDPAARNEWGLRNRSYAEAQFDSRCIVRIQETVLITAAGLIADHEST